MTKFEFDKWVKDMTRKVDYRRLYTYRIPDDLRTVICYDKKIGKVGVARCHPQDKFNLVWGKAIATARCLGIEVPKISTYKKFCELKNGDRFKINSTIIYLFIGKCYGCNNEITYAIQNIETLNIRQVSTAYYNKEVEMVE